MLLKAIGKRRRDTTQLIRALEFDSVDLWSPQRERQREIMAVDFFCGEFSFVLKLIEKIDLYSYTVQKEAEEERVLSFSTVTRMVCPLLPTILLKLVGLVLFHLAFSFFYLFFHGH
ncbi:hypothetical protein ACOSP7_005525 [Xanthoceras sorbifolium]